MQILKHSGVLSTRLKMPSLENFVNRLASSLFFIIFNSEVAERVCLCVCSVYVSMCVGGR